MIIYAIRGRNFNYVSIIVSLFFSIPFLIFFPYSFSMALELLTTMAANLLYSLRSFLFIVLTIFLILTTFALHASLNISTGTSLAVGVGLSISLIVSNDMRKKELENNSKRGQITSIEVKRDVLQIASGVALILSFYILREMYIKFILVFLIIIALFILSFAGIWSSNKFSAFILSFERKNVQPGIGSLWYMAGILLLMGLTGGSGALLVGVFAMAIGDSLATIVGMNIKSFKLPYNRKKSLAGFLGMLISTSLFAVIVFGPLYIIYAIVATFAESLSGYPVDDNFSIPVSIIIVRALNSLI